MFGAPTLLRGLPRAAGLSLLGAGVSRVIDALFPAPTWGVFKPGTTDPAFEVSSVTELDIGGESNVSDYPIETGSFTSYNKVVMPNTFQIRLTRDGSEAQRNAFLVWLQTVCGGLDLFDILCPENSYQNATLKSYRVSRTSGSGAAMIVADCIFQQVRQIPASYSSSTVPDPNNQPPTPTARVNPVPNTSATFP